MASHCLLYIVAVELDVASELGLSEEPYVLAHVPHQPLQVAFLLVAFDAPHVHAAQLPRQLIAHRLLHLRCTCLLLDSVQLLSIVSGLRCAVHGFGWLLPFAILIDLHALVISTVDVVDIGSHQLSV